MKKLLISLLSLLTCLGTFAQTESTELQATFDFTAPETLDPAVVIPEGSPAVNVGNYIFYNDVISISFTDTGVAPDLFNSQQSPELRIYRGGIMYVRSTGVELLSIKFVSFGMSSYGLASGDGTLDYTTDTWKNVDKDGNQIDGISAVSFKWTSAMQGRIAKVIVTYRSPLNTLVTESYSPASNAVVNSFKDMVFTFNKPMASADDVTLKSGTRTVGTLKQTKIEGNTVTMSLDEEIAEPGRYTVNFPSMTFVSTQGFYNKEFNTSFTIEEPRNTFNPISVPDEKVDDAMPTVTEIEFPGNIGNRNALALRKFDVIGKENGKVATADVSFKGFKTMVFTLSDDVNVPDVYTITVPAKTVFDADNVKYNDEFVITYRVAGADAPSDEVLAKAAALLENTGIGYPTEDSEARTKLSEMVRLHNQGDDAFNEAISEFLSTSDVELPAAGEYYSLANVAKNGTKWYIAYSKGAASLTKDASKAYPFLTGDGLTFKTLDGKYLVVLGTTSTNVSDNAKKLNVKKMTVQGEEEATFGMLTIDNGTYYSTVKTDGSVRDEEDVVKFNDTYSAAFKFSPADAPKEEPTETTIVVTTTPDSADGAISELQSVKVSFVDIENVSYSQNPKVYLLSANGNHILPTNFGVNGFKDEYTFYFPALENGKYTFVAPEGAFKYSIPGKQTFAQEITYSFTVNFIDEFVDDYDLQHQMHYSWVAPEEGFPITWFNNFTVSFMQGQQMVEAFITDNIVTLDNPGDQTIARGKFVKRVETVTEHYQGFYRNGEYVGEVAEINDAGDTVLLTDRKPYVIHDGDEIKDLTREQTYYYYDLKFDTVLSSEEERDGIYRLTIPYATYGDANFGKYLEDHSSVMKRECHVNPRTGLSFKINNAATAIQNVTNAEKNSVIYDLSGRRVENMSTPGIYIINGKKYFKK